MSKTGGRTGQTNYKGAAAQSTTFQHINNKKIPASEDDVNRILRRSVQIDNRRHESAEYQPNGPVNQRLPIYNTVLIENSEQEVEYQQYVMPLTSASKKNKT